jgi:Ca2+-binding RTX toxin-like protein
VKIDPGQRESLLGRLALRGGAARGASPLALAGLLAAAIIVLAPAVGRGQAGAPSCAGGPQVIGRQILGTPCADVIVAARGIEEIHGAGGNDVIYATDDVVLIDGGNGDDVMHGELPASLPAGAFLASPPASSVPPEATALQDICVPRYCGDGNQNFPGTPGDDVVFGQRGNDNLSGGPGNDSLYGGTGDDTVNGGLGDDLLSGGFGADVVGAYVDVVSETEVPEEGNDLVRGDAGPDELRGGLGVDTVSFATAVTPGFANLSGYGLPPNNGERGVNVSLGGEAFNRDARWGGGQDSLVTEFENVIGSPFSDYIVGSDDENRIDGGGGADVILAGAGNDQIYGGADGDHLDGGPDDAAIFPGGGDDYCTNPTTPDCERSPANDPDGGVHLRDTRLISVGLMATDISPSPPVVDLYLTGSTAADNVSVAYSAGRVTFTEVGSAAFDTSGDGQTAQCAYPPPTHPRARARMTEVTCDVPHPLDAIVLAGMNGDDNVTTSGFPETTSLVLLGGERRDTLVGSSATEDMLVDGPDFTRTSGWGDTLQGFGGVDALLNNDGADNLSGGDLSDLLVSASVCDGDVLDGGPETVGKNNASWAQLDDPEAVSAQIEEGIAGRPTGGGPVCTGSGEQFDTLQTIDDLEGSNQGDELFGDFAGNYLLGRNGPDSLFGRLGDDLLQTDDGVADNAIDCGPDPDRALIDSTDPTPLNCETVQVTTG